MNRRAIEQLLGIEEEKAKAALLAVSAAQQQLNQCNSQVAALQTYKQEYIAKFQLAGRTGINADSINRHIQFIGKLEQAIVQQQQIEQQLKLRLAQAREHWQKQNQKVKVYQQLLERDRLASEAKANRIEQRLMDEVALQRHIRKLA